MQRNGQKTQRGLLLTSTLESSDELVSLSIRGALWSTTSFAAIRFGQHDLQSNMSVIEFCQYLVRSFDETKCKALDIDVAVTCGAQDGIAFLPKRKWILSQYKNGTLPSGTVEYPICGFGETSGVSGKGKPERLFTSAAAVRLFSPVKR